MTITDTPISPTLVAYFYDKPGGGIVVDFVPNPSDANIRNTEAATMARDVEAFLASRSMKNTLRLTREETT